MSQNSSKLNGYGAVIGSEWYCQIPSADARLFAQPGRLFWKQTVHVCIVVELFPAHCFRRGFRVWITPVRKHQVADFVFRLSGFSKLHKGECVYTP